MKKLYNDPTITISLFRTENILTTSGGDTTKNVTEAATSFFKDKIGENPTIVNFVM